MQRVQAAMVVEQEVTEEVLERMGKESESE